jgi:TolA-binding protein
MRTLWPILALLFIAATVEENNLYRIAQAAYNDGIYDLAERQLAEFLQKFPDSERADAVALQLAQAQLNQGKWRDAVRTLQDALARWPAEKRPDGFRFWLGEALLRGEKYAEAEARYTEVLEKFPRSAYRTQAHYGSALAQFKQSKFDDAAETLQRLVKLGPKGELAEETELLRGQIELARERFEQADGVFEATIKKFPATRTFYRAHIWLAESLARRGQFDEALKGYAVVVDAFKSKPAAAKTEKRVDAQLAAEAWYGMGWVHWQQQNFDPAAAAFSSALTVAQTPELKRDALLKLGEAYVRAGKLADGVAKLKAFLQANPADPIADEVQMTVADLLFGNGEFAAALPEYARLISQHPQSALRAKANFYAGACADKLSQPNDALKFFQQAFESAGQTDTAMAEQALFKLGDVQFGLGRFTDAINSYQRLISSYPASQLIDHALFQLGQSYQRTRNAEAAAVTYESLVEQFPHSVYAPEAQFQVGLIEVGLGNEEQARAAFTAVVEKFSPGEWADRAALANGESFYREGKYDEAIATFEKLIAAGLGTDLGERAFYNRGWCYLQQGQADKTLAEFTEFLKKFPQSQLAADVQFWVADYYMKQRDYIRSQENYQALVRDHPKSKLAETAQYYAARSAYARQDYKAAIELYEALLKTFPQSGWRCDARFGQGDALTELGQFDDALLVFDSLIKEFPDCYLLCEAQGRKGDCQFTLARFEDAGISYRNALTCAREADPATRYQIHYKIGQSQEKAGKLADAFEQYAKPLYESLAVPDPTAPRERFWTCKAGLAAAGIKEQQQQWREAIKLYERLLDLCPDLKPLVEERIRKLRVEHLILF